MVAVVLLSVSLAAAALRRAQLEQAQRLEPVSSSDWVNWLRQEYTEHSPGLDW